jgi:hypothetical protein
MIITGKYAASSVLMQQGIVLDLEKKCYTLTRKILGLFNNNDDCKNLPKVEYVLMFKTFYAKCEPCQTDEKDSPVTIQLSLVYNKNRRLIVHESKNMKEIKSLAEQLASWFNVRIRDSATNRRAPKWLPVNSSCAIPSTGSAA